MTNNFVVKIKLISEAEKSVVYAEFVYVKQDVILLRNVVYDYKNSLVLLTLSINERYVKTIEMCDKEDYEKYMDILSTAPSGCKNTMCACKEIESIERATDGIDGCITSILGSGVSSKSDKESRVVGSKSDNYSEVVGSKSGSITDISSVYSSKLGTTNITSSNTSDVYKLSDHTSKQESRDKKDSTVQETTIKQEAISKQKVNTKNDTQQRDVYTTQSNTSSITRQNIKETSNLQIGTKYQNDTRNEYKDRAYNQDTRSDIRKSEYKDKQYQNDTRSEYKNNQYQNDKQYHQDKQYNQDTRNEYKRDVTTGVDKKLYKQSKHLYKKCSTSDKEHSNREHSSIKDRVVYKYKQKRYNTVSGFVNAMKSVLKESTLSEEWRKDTSRNILEVGEGMHMRSRMMKKQ